jgi:hypothetical protein
VSALDEFLGNAEGLKLPRGCPDCNGYIIIAKGAPDLWSHTVYHDHGCPSQQSLDAW